MRTRLRTSSMALALAVLLGMTACNDEWGKQDPPAGNQVYPTLQTVSTFAFEDETGAPALPAGSKLVSYDGGAVPEVVFEDAEAKSQVLVLNNGYASFDNPLTAIKCQKAACVSFWMKQPLAYDEETGYPTTTQDIITPLISFVNPMADGTIFSRDDDGTPADEEEAAEEEEATEEPVYGTLVFTANGMIHYDATDGEFIDNNPEEYKTGYFTPDEWHYVNLIVRDNGYAIYIDGLRKLDKVVPKFDSKKMVNFMNNAQKVYFNYANGATSASELWIDDVTFYRNEITNKEIARPKKGNIGSNSGPGGGPSGPTFVALPEPIFFNNFERGLGECTIMGKGSITDFGDKHGRVFQNVGGEIRSNFLLLPSDALMRTGETEEMTVTFWVNAKNAGNPDSYMWTPIFSAYSDYSPGGNHAPLICCQYRGNIANNMNGPDNVGGNWCDYVDANCDQGKVTILHNENDWLADHQWHMYTCTFTKTTAAVYFDDQLINSWTIDGVSDGQRCEIFGKSELSYICIGGNQSWWADPDLGAAFDDVAIYNKALNADQVSTLYARKDMYTPIYYNDFERGIGEATIMGGGSVKGFGGNFGYAFQNIGGAIRSNFLVLPEDVLMRTGETEEMTINFWVNATNAGAPDSYMWTPIFSAYSDYSPGGNHAPLICCQYRGNIANNMNGPDNVGGNWCDYVDANCDQGKVTILHNENDWLADHQWHMYTCTFTKTTAAVYFDSELLNSWTIDGVSDGQRCEIFGKPELNFICVGGNQSWWADPDLGAAFDDVKIYNHALTADDVAALYQMK